MNYVMPKRGVLSLHCSANKGPAGDVALFFGLSGTGKTTLSSDPDRALIGDDEHGWSDRGMFNFEGGCYAKTIRINPEFEPLVWSAINRFGCLLENVPLDRDRGRILIAAQSLKTRGLLTRSFSSPITSQRAWAGIRSISSC